MCLALGGTIGMTFLVLACALRIYGLWWPFFVVIFYLLAVLPRGIVSSVNSSSGTGSWKDVSVFFSTGSILSSFALPIVLARASVIAFGACYLTIAGNIVIFATLAFYFSITQSESDSYMGAF